MVDENLKLGGITVKCPVCNENTAMEEKFEGITSWICTNCGYTSNTEFTEGNEELQKSPQMFLDNLFWDVERQIYWVLSTMQHPSKGFLFPVMNSGQIEWTYIPLVDIVIEDQKNYPIEGSDKFYSQKLDPDQSKVFKTFKEGLIALGSILVVEEDKK